MVKIGDDAMVIGNGNGARILKSPKQLGLDGMLPVLSAVFTEDDNTTFTQVACMRIVGNPPYREGSGGAGGAVRPGLGLMGGGALVLGLLAVLVF